MSINKETVHTYMEGFNKLNHKMILSSLTDDVEWILPGAFHHSGKEAFNKEIENPAFTGAPLIRVTRVIEENNVVITEGTVRTKKITGEVATLAFCDVFEMREGKIRKLTSYLMPLS